MCGTGTGAMMRLLASASVAFATGNSATATPFALNRFLVSFWVDPIVPPDQFGFEYARIAAANFTALLGGFGAADPATVKLQVEACANAGLDCLPSSCESEAGPNPGGSCVGVAAPVLGYQMKDEPAEADFGALAAWMASVATRAPGALRFVNLLPNYGFPPPSSEAYTAYVSAFVSTCRPDILCFDAYPTFYPGSASDTSSDLSMAGYHRNLHIIRAQALGAGVLFMNFMGAMPYGGHADYTEAQMRWQVFTSLAYGARGVLYFCYWTPTGSTFQWANAILTPRALPGQPLSSAVYMPGPHYFQVQRINAKLRVYGDFLLRAQSALVLLANGTGTSNVTVPPTPGAGPFITTLGGAGAGASWSALLGVFTSPPQRSQAFLLHNQDPDTPLLVAVGLAPGAVPYEVDPVQGTLAVALDDAPGMPGWQVNLDPGDARLFVF